MQLPPISGFSGYDEPVFSSQAENQYVDIILTIAQELVQLVLDVAQQILCLIVVVDALEALDVFTAASAPPWRCAFLMRLKQRSTTLACVDKGLITKRCL